MITWKLNKLIGECKDGAGGVTYREISRDTGLSTSILTTIAQNKVSRADLNTIDALLLFFSEKLGRRLTTQDILEFTPPAPAPTASAPTREQQRRALAPPDAADQALTPEEEERRKGFLMLADQLAATNPDPVTKMVEGLTKEVEHIDNGAWRMKPPAARSLEAALERQKLGIVLTVEERTLIRNARAMGQV